MADKPKKPVMKSITQGEFYTELAEATGKSKADVKAFYEALVALIAKHLGKKNGGVLKLPNLLKMKSIRKKAEKGGDTYFNRLTGKEMKRPPKAAYTKITASALKPLKESVNPKESKESVNPKE
jgi:nucleoid DNA-binding protein